MTSEADHLLECTQGLVLCRLLSNLEEPSDQIGVMAQKKRLNKNTHAKTTAQGADVRKAFSYMRGAKGFNCCPERLVSEPALPHGNLCNCGDILVGACKRLNTK